MMEDPVFWKVLGNNLWFALVTIPTSIALAIPGRSLVRMAYFTPTILPMITPEILIVENYVTLARPTYLAYALVSISHHWNNFLWPLIITNSVETRPLTVGLGIFGAPESGVNWSIVSAATLLSVAPLLIAFLLFQRQFVQSFMYAGIK
ncbi:MAG: hypothetical protein V2J08_03905 [Desulfotignum sp.]|jgi:ABC-type glycerol-3-phosphate transport system permease component|nr:hypothetical protein [Desulfotignum sp.]